MAPVISIAQALTLSPPDSLGPSPPISPYQRKPSLEPPAPPDEDFDAADEVEPGDPPGFLRVDFGRPKNAAAAGAVAASAARAALNASDGTDAGVSEQLHGSEGAEQLGIVFEWSTALPVVADVREGSPAAAYPELSGGAVLLAVNEFGLCCGVQREEVEYLLCTRPLTLLLEKAAPERHLEMGRSPWRRSWKRRCAHLPPEKPKLTSEWPDEAEERGDQDAQEQTQQKEQQDERATSSLTRPTPLPLLSPGSSKLSPLSPGSPDTEATVLWRQQRRPSGTNLSLLSTPHGMRLALQSSEFEGRGVVSPTGVARGLAKSSSLGALSRSGSTVKPLPQPSHAELPLPLRTLQPRVLNECLLQTQELPDLRSWHLDLRALTLPRLTQQYARPGQKAKPRKPESQLARDAQQRMQAQAKSWRRLRCLARGEPLPPPRDLCYEDVPLDGRPRGAGPAVRWTLDHGNVNWLCRMSDFVLASRVREAYECGFRGVKAERVAVAQSIVQRSSGAGSTAAGSRATPLYDALLGSSGRGVGGGSSASSFSSWQGTLVRRPPARVEEVTCDLCGVEMADFDNSGPFYYCRCCKNRNHRYELCVACHALEVLQAEGKHTGASPHPHWESCSHMGMKRFAQLSDAYPDAVHLRWATCDCCGHSTRGTAAGDDAIWVCQACPEKNGFRFELCESCAVDLREQGFRRVREAQELQIAAASAPIFS
eukprot:TRINITY_DN8646_c0_g5_i1.p1 TRINITY_DN8646_c0_g5~~TRINITY_DN8646_c0_g5_i1.p1  ORF type:complete len:711 (-),score=165.52 TRINITY_DN8646_c0_g5_i1:241-2373(-)